MLCNAYDDMSNFSARSKHQRCYIYPLVQSVSHSSHSPVPYFFSCPRTFLAIAFAYFSFRVRRVEFVSWSRSCCWLGHLEFSSCVFPHRFHQICAFVTNFAHIVPVLSSNSEPILKTGLVFAYELRFRRSIYQNRSEKVSNPSIPRVVGVRKF